MRRPWEFKYLPCGHCQWTMHINIIYVFVFSNPGPDYDYIVNVTSMVFDLIKKNFGDVPVIPALGNSFRIIKQID